MAFPDLWSQYELITASKLNEWYAKLSCFEKDSSTDTAIAAVSKIVIGSTTGAGVISIYRNTSDSINFEVLSSNPLHRPALIFNRYGDAGGSSPNNARTGAIGFNAKGTDNSLFTAALIDSYIGTNQAGNVPSDLRFYANSGSGLVERLRIANSVSVLSNNLVVGNSSNLNSIKMLSPNPTSLYIQTTSPNAILSFNRDVILGSIDDTNKAVCDLYLNSSNNASSINFRTSNTNGVAPVLRLTIGPEGALKYYAITTTPSNPTAGNEMNIYLKNNKLVIQYNDAGTVRYKYLDLTGTGVTWTHTTTAP